MRIMLAVLALASGPLTAAAQQAIPSNGYRVCAPEQTMQGRTIVREACGDLVQPDFADAGFASVSELEAAGEARETFLAEITAYAACVSGFIDAARQPGMPADSLAPDQAACAHSWAEEQATQAVRDYGRACIAYSDRSMMDSSLTPWSGACYPTATGNNG